MRKPDFFIIGAPKCGTTALCEYLRFHPQVFVSEPKEPHYFADDFSGLQVVRDEQAYLELFRAAGPGHRALGEGSVYYLYSDSALQKIRTFQPDARIIVMLRDPVDMLPSYHAQMLYTVVEDEENFERAWELQEERKNGHHIPRGCLDSRLLEYRRWGMLGSRLARVLEIFDQRNVKVIFFEDFIRDTRSYYLDVLAFLDVEDDGRTDFPPVNERKEHKSRLFGYLLNNRALMENISWLARFMEKVGLNPTSLKDYVKSLNARKPKKSELSDEFRERLRREFAGDTGLLAGITGRNLDHWVRGGKQNDR